MPPFCSSSMRSVLISCWALSNLSLRSCVANSLGEGMEVSLLRSGLICCSKCLTLSLRLSICVRSAALSCAS